MEQHLADPCSTRVLGGRDSERERERECVSECVCVRSCVSARPSWDQRRAFESHQEDGDGAQRLLSAKLHAMPQSYHLPS